MPAKCFVPGCCSGTMLSKEKRRFYCPSKNANLSQWATNINHQDRKLDHKSKICELHFEERYILKYFITTINNQEVRLPRDRWILTKDAVPTLFPDLGGSLQSQVPKETEEESAKHVKILPCGEEDIDPGPVKKLTILPTKSSNKHSYTKCSKHLEEVGKPLAEMTTLEETVQHPDSAIDYEQLKLPNQSWSVFPGETKNPDTIVICQVLSPTSSDQCPRVNKSVTISQSKAAIFLGGKAVAKEVIFLQHPFTSQQLTTTLVRLHLLKSCPGASRKTPAISFCPQGQVLEGRWYAKACSRLLPRGKRLCKPCMNLKRSIQRRGRGYRGALDNSKYASLSRQQLVTKLKAKRTCLASVRRELVRKTLRYRDRMEQIQELKEQLRKFRIPIPKLSNMFG